MKRIRVDEKLNRLIIAHRDAMQRTMGRRVPLREATSSFADSVREYYEKKKRFR